MISTRLIVGRVGALAVALGIGAAAVALPGLALADAQGSGGAGGSALPSLDRERKAVVRQAAAAERELRRRAVEHLAGQGRRGGGVVVGDAQPVFPADGERLAAAAGGLHAL
ncbi:MAG: hypothetical protein FGM52_12190, partial [Mycobacterium sp.]|nr:hypothetical protein [Mycobacterium sp.]